MPGRIRTSVKRPELSNWHCEYSGGIYPHLQLTYPVYGVQNWPTYSSYISDFVGNRQGINPVYQVVLKSDVTRLVDFWNIDGARIHNIVEDWVPIDSSQMHTNGIISTPTAAQFSSWSIDAFNAFHDQIPREFSVGNFLYELRDIKGMIPKLERSISKTASSNFLAYNFGIAPFVGDVGKMLTLMEIVTKRLQHLKDTLGKEVDLRFSRKVEEPLGPSIFQVSPATGWGFTQPTTFEFRRLSYTGKFSASTKLIQNLEGLSDPISSVKAYAAGLGLNNPLAIVWEAIPYSFVIDWFFKVGNLLDTLAIQPFGGEWSLRSTVSSFKDEYLYSVYQNFFPSVSGNQKEFLGTAWVRRYSRTVGLPVSSVFATDLTLTPKQQALSLALLNQLR